MLKIGLVKPFQRSISRKIISCKHSPVRVFANMSTKNRVALRKKTPKKFYKKQVKDIVARRLLRERRRNFEKEQDTFRKTCKVACGAFIGSFLGVSIANLLFGRD